MWDKIEVLLKEKNMTMYAVSKKAGIKQGILIALKSASKKGQNKRMYFDNVAKIARALEVDLDYFAD